MLWSVMRLKEACLGHIFIVAENTEFKIQCLTWAMMGGLGLQLVLSFVVYASPIIHLMCLGGFYLGRLTCNKGSNHAYIKNIKKKLINIQNLIIKKQLLYSIT